VALSERLALARPNATLATFAQKLCELYLLQDIPFDTSCTDTIYLEKPGHARRTWRWQVGVNFFAAQGDMRWWHDHRIPGGIAFSMTSVGHVAKAGAINRAMLALDKAIGEKAEDWDNSHIESLEKALVLAMRTIHVASGGTRPGTRLFDASERHPSLDCPIRLPPGVSGYDYCEYFGYYHTDHTLPSDYFADAMDRPAEIQPFEDLDFTYLFDRLLDDFVTMGEGLRVRADEFEGELTDERAMKREKAVAVDVDVDDEELLCAALAHVGRLRNS
jgi:hypothetical protein